MLLTLKPADRFLRAASLGLPRKEKDKEEYEEEKGMKKKEIGRL